MSACRRCGRGCDGCSLCCCEHPGHRLRWEPYGCPECRKRWAAVEQGRLLANERDDLIARPTRRGSVGSAYQHRPEDGCEGRRCLCADEFKAELDEVRVARVPDSARTEAG